MIIGYIVTDKKMKGIDGFVEQVSDISFADSAKPILIVGWKKAKTVEGYTTILDKQLSDNVFWTFSKSESRSDFEQDLKQFYEFCYNSILNKIKYYYINIFKLNNNKIKKLFNIVYSRDRKNIYISNNFVYIPYEGNVLGLSLKMLSYCGINSDKVIEKIKSNCYNRILDDSDMKVSRLSRKLENKKYAIPYFIDI